MCKFFTVILLLCVGRMQAAPGDTTWVSVHNAVDMTYYGNYDQTGFFPSGATSYSQVLLYWTMGCASTGCSDWDYDVHVRAGKYLGFNDSSVASVDTLLGDTTWSVFPAIEFYELAEVVTPYGGYMASGTGGFNNSWKHNHIFDVTDFATILRDSVRMRAFYSGYSSGFSTTLKFAFIEGTPPRNVLDIKNMYNSYVYYPNSSGFESNVPLKNIVPVSGTKQGRFRTIITGHGFDNSVSCAEFCPKNYTVLVNGITRYTQSIWRDDCGINPIYPQGGTWLYDRANWCPGLRANVQEHELTEFIDAATPYSLNLDMDVYTWTGTQTPGYAIASQLISYGVTNFANDVAILEIVAPGKIDDYKRINPICGKPIIKIQNNGSTTMTACAVNYGIVGGTPCKYYWEGSLAAHAHTEISLPELNWAGINVSNPQFFAEVSEPNFQLDEVMHNNKIISNFNLVPQVDSTFVIWISTNNRASENAYYVYDSEGNTVFQRTSLANTTQYKDTITLPKGCYTFVLTDSDGDGLDWWANSDESSGFARFRKATTFVSIKNFVADFGKEIRYNFSVNQQGGNTNFICNETSIDNVEDATKIDVYPNPAHDELTIDIAWDANENGTISLYNLSGQLVAERTKIDMYQKSHRINVNDLEPGFYFITIKSASHFATKKIVIEK